MSPVKYDLLALTFISAQNVTLRGGGGGGVGRVGEARLWCSCTQRKCYRTCNRKVKDMVFMVLVLGIGHVKGIVTVYGNGSGIAGVIQSVKTWGLKRLKGNGTYGILVFG